MSLQDCPPTFKIVKLQSLDAERDSINAALQALSRCLGHTQTAVQYQDEGINLGTAGTVGTINFAGSGVVATRVGDVVTITVTGGGGGGGLTDVDEGVGISIDKTNPAIPVINNTGILSVFGVNVDNTNPQDPEILPAPGAVVFTIGNPPPTAGAIIPTGTYFYQLPAMYELSDWQMYVYPAASVTVDVRYDVFPTLPTAGDSITSGSSPSISAANSNTGLVTGWNPVQLYRGDWIAFAITSNDVATFISLSLQGGKY